MPTVSLIVPVHRGGQKFQACYESIQQLSPQPNEIILVADGGWKHTPQPQPADHLQMLQTPVAKGPGHARNLGARAASGDILFFVDADVTVKSDAIARVRHEFEQDAGLSALIGSYDSRPSEPDFVSQYRNLLHHYIHQIADEDASTFWGACGAIRRVVFLEFGGFDEVKYERPAIEDVELGMRVKNAGHSLRLVKDLQVKHLKKWGFWGVIKNDVCQRAIPWTHLILENKEMTNDLNVDQSSRLSVAAVFLLGASVMSAIVWPPAWIAVIPLAGGLLYLNWHVYRFFYNKRGLWFALRSVPMHWIYYLYSGIAFAVGIGQHIIRRQQ